MLWSWNSWCESWLQHCQFSALEQFTEPLPPCVRYDCLGNLMHYLCVSDSILLERVFWMQIPHLKSNPIQYLAIPVPKELLLLFCRYYQILIHEPDPIVCLPLNTLCIQTRRYFFPLPKISKIWTFLSISIAIHKGSITTRLHSFPTSLSDSGLALTPNLSSVVPTGYTV